MANPTFIAHFTLNYLGDKEWEIYDHCMLDDMPAFQGDDESSFVGELVIELANEHFNFNRLPEGGMCICLVAGELIHRTWDGPEGRDHDLDIEIDWSHFRVLSELDVQILTEPAEDFDDVQLT